MLRIVHGGLRAGPAPTKKLTSRERERGGARAGPHGREQARTPLRLPEPAATPRLQ